MIGYDAFEGSREKAHAAGITVAETRGRFEDDRGPALRRLRTPFGLWDGSRLRRCVGWIIIGATGLLLHR